MKRKRNKRYAVLYTILCCVLFLSGCGGGNGSEKIDAPVDIRYIVQNPLTFSEVEENDQFDRMVFTGKYPQISGLNDRQVADKINEDLRNMYEEYQPGEVPPEAKEKYSDLECAEQDIRLICCGNFNNVLSVSASYTWKFGELFGERAPSYQGYYEKTKTYNVDLNTGAEISLKEVFADNVDYGKMINLAEPQFALHNSMLEARGVRDGIEETITLNFDENFAVTERFYDPGKSIYSNDQEGKKTLLTYVGEEEGWEKQYTEEGIDFYLRGSYQKEFPAQMQQAIKEEEAANGKLIDQMKQVLKGIANQEVNANYSKNVNTSRVQDFINVRIYENADIYSDKTNTFYLLDSRQTLRCYRMGSDEPTRIRDVFYKEADAEKILETVVFNKLEANQQLLEESGYRRNIDAAVHAKDAADKFVGFCVNYESIIAEYLGDPALPSYVIELKYADIGYENLNIFERL